MPNTLPLRRTSVPLTNEDRAKLYEYRRAQSEGYTLGLQATRPRRVRRIGLAHSVRAWLYGGPINWWGVAALLGMAASAYVAAWLLSMGSLWALDALSGGGL